MITNQAQLFLIFVVNGILIGLLFDFFRILRKAIKTKDIVTYIEDILFWILTGFILLFSICTFNNGEIRLYMFIGTFIGVFLYMISISTYVIKINMKIIDFFKLVMGKIINIIIIPIKLVKKIFLKPVTFIFINIRKISTSILKKIKISKQNQKIRLKKKELKI